jgi:hypothetical protein
VKYQTVLGNSVLKIEYYIQHYGSSSSYTGRTRC